MAAWSGFVLVLACLLTAFECALGDSSIRIPPWFVHHDFACHEVNANQWTRRICFGKLLRLDAEKDPEAPEVSRTSSSLQRLGLLRLAVTIDTTGRSGPRSPKAKCGDTIRARFVSDEGLVWFASVMEKQSTCRSYELVFEPPPHPGNYWLEFRLIHINGEGMLDPDPEIDWHAHVLAGNSDSGLRGPSLYNLRIRITGRLQVLEAKPDRQRLKEPSPCRVMQAPPPAPRCTRGDHRGRWTGVDDPLYPPFEGEPIHWLPYGCRYRVHTTESLRQCLQPQEKAPRIWFVGESIMQHIFLLLMGMLEGDYEGKKTNSGLYYWPPYHKMESEINLGPDPRLRVLHHHGLGIILPALKEEMGLWKLSPSHIPSALVFLSAHNDMMRRSMALYTQHLSELISMLKGADYRGQIIWVTSPTRLYKSIGGQPGECSCPGGRSRKCGRESSDPNCLCQCGMRDHWVEEKMETTWDAPLTKVIDYPWFLTRAGIEHRGAGGAHAGGRLSWDGLKKPVGEVVGHSAHMPLVHNTYARIKWANEKAVAMMKEAFPGRIHIVDFAALTDALTPDYCFDGLHWSCERLHVFERMHAPWHCRNLANIVVTNILANVLCGGLKL
eukprot:jgi/Mesvir1/21695/Mv04115-RA.1